MNTWKLGFGLVVGHHRTEKLKLFGSHLYSLFSWNFFPFFFFFSPPFFFFSTVREKCLFWVSHRF